MGCTGSIIGMFTGTPLECAGQMTSLLPMERWGARDRSLERSRERRWNVAGQMTSPLSMERWGARDRSLECSRERRWNAAGQMTSLLPMERWGARDRSLERSLERRWTDDFASPDGAMGCTGSIIGTFMGSLL